ncbi:MAG: putative ABC transporter permease protein [Chloroflexi bacterium ADurb.Bin325]|nr:MAG: putative ABC transporter permease protein [Chloroflexi bacterium ADurb.Bin325]
MTWRSLPRMRPRSADETLAGLRRLRRDGRLRLWLLLALPIPLAVIALALGRYEISLATMFQAVGRALVGQPAATAAETLVLQVRLPRILAALLIGAALGGSGAAFQGIFKNPLVDSNILGVTSGAGFGAALALLLTGSLPLASLAAFICGLAAVLLAYLGAHAHGGSHTLMLTLSGILVGSFFGALTSLVKILADPLSELPAITFWLLGGLSDVTWRSLPLLFLVTGLGGALLLALRWRLNVLSLGDREAAALGLNTRRMKLLIVGVASLLTAAAVAVGGVIGWVGLVIPHAGRLLVGPDHRRLLPVSLSLGAAFLLVIDTLARATLPRETPLGVFTGIVGVPVLFVLLRRGRSGAGWVE